MAESMDTNLNLNFYVLGKLAQILFLRVTFHCQKWRQQKVDIVLSIDQTYQMNL